MKPPKFPKSTIPRGGSAEVYWFNGPVPSRWK